VNERQFLWGLSNGVTALAVAGAFWIGLGIGMVAPRVHWLVSALSMVVQVGGCASLLWAAVRLRRKSDFRRSQLRQSNGRNGMEARHIVAGFAWTVVVQTVLIGSAVFLCVRAHAEQMIWPSIGLVVSLHLIPLGKIFHVRAYYGTAVIGSLVSLATFAMGRDLYAVVYLGGGMAAAMWVSAVYLLSNASRITGRALREPWTV
jgi:hypothetical protein